MDQARRAQDDVSTATSLRRRPDLQVCRQEHGRQRFWAVKDPVANRFFLLREEEHAILEMLDGRHSVEQVVAQFNERFAPRRLSVTRCQAFIAQLHQNGLIVSTARGQGALFRQREAASRQRERTSAATNWLAIRWRGLNPDGLLGWLEPRLRWLYSPVAGLLCTLLVLAASLLICFRFEQLRDRWPDFYALFAAQNTLWLLLVLVVMKLGHELAHGLTCKHFGGACHELGVLFLAFVPCLYCDVTDSWMMPNRWHRIAVAAAGMAFELVVAAVATFVWWSTAPGPLHATCRNVMLVCGVTTILLNSNPLMRFDGYFILSDLLGIPNLHMRSRLALRRLFFRFAWGVDLGDDRAMPERHTGWLAAFAIASTVYRWSILLAIACLANAVLTRYHLGFLVPLLLLLFLGGTVIPQIVRYLQLFFHPQVRQQVRWPRALLSGLIGTVVVAFCFLPLPHRVKTNALIRAEGAQIVYATAPGRLIEAVQLGQFVEQDQSLVTLENQGVRLLMEQVRGDYQQQQLHVEHLKAQRVFDSLAKRELPEANDVLADLAQRLAAVEREQQRLTLRAPRAGYVLPLTSSIREPLSARPLRQWSGSPLEPRNDNCFIEAQTPICLVGDQRREAVLAIDQKCIDLVEVGQRVDIYLGSRITVQGVIREIAQRAAKLDARDLRADAALQHRLDRIESDSAFHTLYEARVELVPPDVPLLVGLRGRAKIVVQPRSLGQRAANYLLRSFRRDS